VTVVVAVLAVVVAVLVWSGVLTARTLARLAARIDRLEHPKPPDGLDTGPAE